MDKTSSAAKTSKLSSEATEVETAKSPAKGKVKGKIVKPPKPKAPPKTKKKDIKIVEKTLVNSDEETAIEGEPEPPPPIKPGENTNSASEAGGDKDDNDNDNDNVRNKQFNFLDDEKLDLFKWLVSEDMVTVHNKVFKKIFGKSFTKLTDKALQYVRCDVTCHPVQLYNFFKSNRRIYTNYLALIKKYGIEAVDITTYSELSQYVIKIYSNHAAKTGATPVSRPRHVARRVLKGKHFMYNLKLFTDTVQTKNTF